MSAINCSLAIHVNFVVSVGGFDVREKPYGSVFRGPRRTGDEDFAANPPPRADTKARDAFHKAHRSAYQLALLLPVLSGVRGTLWEKLATDKIGSRLIWSAAKNVTQDTLALTKDLWSKGVLLSLRRLGQLSIPSPLRPSRNVHVVEHLWRPFVSCLGPTAITAEFFNFEQ
jgi:hypothetical protein